MPGKRSFAKVTSFEDQSRSAKKVRSASVRKEVTQALNRRGLIPEVKMYVIASRDATLTSNGLWVGFTQDIAQGDTALTRDGNRIAVKKITIKFLVDRPEGDQSATIPNYQVRAVLLNDRFPDGAIPTSLAVDHTVINNSEAILVGRDDNSNGYFVNACVNTLMKQRYQIYNDIQINAGENFEWNYAAAVEFMAASWTKVYTLTKTFAVPLVMVYNGSTGGVAQAVKNNLGIAFYPSTNESMGVSWTLTVEFTDC